MRFFLGTHMTGWLATVTAPLFVSHRRLAPRKTLPRAAAPWALDSGGFTELNLHGRWTVTPQAYAAAVARYKSEIGGLEWCAPQDWMCEAVVLKRTGLTITEHQRRSVQSVADLRGLGAPAIPVLQGWDLDDYLHCVDLYDRAGFDLRNEPVVGLGTVCRRQGTKEATKIVRNLRALGLNLHGFGYKTTGLQACGDALVSADSMAWSLSARYRPALPGHTHKTCANCLPYALAWRERLLAVVQPDAGDSCAGACVG